MFVALSITTALRIRKPDDRWFRCRAYAENFKGAVWRFIMASPNASAEGVQNYLGQIKQLGDRLPDLQYEFTRLGGSGHLITPWMDEVKSLTLPEKLELYRKSRIEDQIQWYSSKSAFNNRAEKLSFTIMFCLEFGAVAMSAIQAWKLSSINFTGAIVTVGTSIIAWSQIKRFSDLETSYAIAAIDLRRLAEEYFDISSQEQTNAMVAEVEAAVSREHTLWLAKRIPSAC